MKKLLLLLIIPLLFSCTKKREETSDSIIENIVESSSKKNTHKTILIEIFAEQSKWTARYAGADNILGASHVSAIHEDIENPSANNPLGIITKVTMTKQIETITSTIRKDSIKLELEQNIIKKNKIEAILEKNIERRQRYIANFVSADEKGLLEQGQDDIIISAKDGKLVLPKGKEIMLKFRSKDVIHSAYLPHFKVQRDCVPGFITQFAFTPTMTTKEYQEYLQDTIFTYILRCNKICGVSHYEMSMEVEVKEEEDYNTWIANQKTISN
tara:strand:+ start:482 stop:1291 length:810 start_codon:yes stop_codon:yes gene_type:complete